MVKVETFHKRGSIATFVAKGVARTCGVRVCVCVQFFVCVRGGQNSNAVAILQLVCDAVFFEQFLVYVVGELPP